MKTKLSLCIAALSFVSISFGQTDKAIQSTIKQVTVFTYGAQIEREAAINLPAGQSTFRLTGLSPEIRKESIRVDGDGSFTIISVQHQNDYLNELTRNEESQQLKQQEKELADKIEEEGVWLKIIQDKLAFLQANKQVSGKDQALNPESFKSLTSLYGSNLESLNLEQLKRQRAVKAYQQEIDKIEEQLVSLAAKETLPSGTILVSIESKQAHNSKLHFNYLVENAAWYPSYDMRFLGLQKPLNVTYKANIRQNTGVDWKDVKLVLSTARTNISAKIPVLDPFFLNFYQPQLENYVSDFEPVDDDLDLIANETETDASSQIKIRGAASLDKQKEPLYIVDGVAQNTLPHLNPNQIKDMQVLKDASATGIYGSRAANGVVLITTKKSETANATPPTISTKSETVNEYLVDVPQTILSNAKTSTVNYRNLDLAADFEYQAVPKLSENVYLIGKIADWYKAELLDGEVNVYLENSYVGKSRIDTQQFNDSLDISFGIDNNITIKREKMTEFSENQFIGQNRKETVAYKLTIRNNKAYAISCKLEDQIPVSKTKDIQVDVITTSGAKADADSGKLEWAIDLKPNETKELIIKYAVKYPKEKQVLVE